MAKAGVAEAVIIAKIKSSPGSFDTSVEQLGLLKEAGVSEAVTIAMVQFPLGNKSSAHESDEVVPNEPKAIVYIYRRTDKMRLRPSVFVDNKEVARTEDGRFFVLKLDPGPHDITVNKGKSGGTVQFQAGRRYFFRSSFEPDFWKPRGTLELIPRETARLEVAKLQPLDPKSIKDKNLVVSNYPEP